MKTKRKIYAHYLTAPIDPVKHGEKCEHNRGRWVVHWDGKHYFFEHATQLQKDIWLGDMRDNGMEKEAIEALRWLCFECGTVQTP